MSSSGPRVEELQLSAVVDTVRAFECGTLIEKLDQGLGQSERPAAAVRRQAEARFKQLVENEDAIFTGVKQ